MHWYQLRRATAHLVFHQFAPPRRSKLWFDSNVIGWWEHMARPSSEVLTLGTRNASKKDVWKNESFWRVKNDTIGLLVENNRSSHNQSLGKPQLFWNLANLKKKSLELLQSWKVALVWLSDSQHGGGFLSVKSVRFRCHVRLTTNPCRFFHEHLL